MLCGAQPHYYLFFFFFKSDDFLHVRLRFHAYYNTRVGTRLFLTIIFGIKSGPDYYARGKAATAQNNQVETRYVGPRSGVTVVITRIIYVRAIITTRTYRARVRTRTDEIDCATWRRVPRLFLATFRYYYLFF